MPRPLPDAPPLACLTGWSTPKPRPFHAKSPSLRVAVSRPSCCLAFLVMLLSPVAVPQRGRPAKGGGSPPPSPQPVSREGPAFSGLIPCFSSHQKKKALWPKHRR